MDVLSTLSTCRYCGSTEILRRTRLPICTADGRRGLTCNVSCEACNRWWLVLDDTASDFAPHELLICPICKGTHDGDDGEPCESCRGSGAVCLLPERERTEDM